jgi:hypothetical protein
VNDDDTAPYPVPTVRWVDPYRHERIMLLALAVAYLAAGAVLGFACFELASIADQINSTPYCRRI